MEAILAQPRGFCAGVVRAVDIVERALQRFDPPVYVLHEIVHNRHVVEDLEMRGAIFVESLEDIPAGAVTIFSAHGVSETVRDQAQERGLRVIDATCPLVTKVHRQAQRFDEDDREVIIVGHPDHPEVLGTRGSIAGPVQVLCSVEEVESLEVRDPSKLAYVTQTTLSMDDTRDVVEALKARFPDIRGPGLKDICYATQNRQNAVRSLAQACDVVLVVGTRNSSNSNRLREVAEQQGGRAHLVEREEDADGLSIGAGERVGITAGASAPEALVQRVVERLGNKGLDTVYEGEGVHETVTFALPEELA